MVDATTLQMATVVAPFALRLPHPREGVRRLAGLGDRDAQGPLLHHGIAVPVLRPEVHLDGDPRQPLDHELSDEGRVPRRPAGDQGHLLHGGDLFEGKRQCFEENLTGLRSHAAREGVEDRPRLLVDLLQHEVAVAAFLRHRRGPVDPLRSVFPWFAREVGDPQPRRRGDHHLPVIEEDHIAGVCQERGQVGCEEELPLPQPDHHRAVQARPHQRPRLPVGHREEGVRPANLRDRPAHRLLERLPRRDVLVQKMGDHLGVRLRGELAALRDQLLLERPVVLDDPVVNDGDVPRQVRVRVLVGGAPVGGPPRVPHAARPRNRLLRDPLRQAGDLPLGLADGDSPAGLDRDPRRIVPAILEPPQAVHEDLNAGIRAGVADDAAHVTSSPSSTRGRRAPLF